MNKAEFGALQVTKSLGAKPDDYVLIIHENNNIDTINLIESEFKKITSNTFLINIDNYERPLMYVPEEITKHLTKATIVIYAAQKSAAQESIHLVRPIKSQAIKKSRFCFTPGINMTMLETGMNIDYQELKEFSTKVYNELKQTKKLTVTTKIGTNLNIEFNNDSIWKNTYGDLTTIPQDGYNLPSGEVFTWPSNLNGTFVIDGEIAGQFLKYNNLQTEPLILEIKDSIITKATSNNKELEVEFNEFINKYQNANQINEAGFGTNLGIKDYFGIMLQDEKIPGIHLAIGNPCDGTTKKTNIKSEVHIDMLIKHANLKTDTKVIMQDGIYTI